MSLRTKPFVLRRARLAVNQAQDDPTPFDAIIGCPMRTPEDGTRQRLLGISTPARGLTRASQLAKIKEDVAPLGQMTPLVVGLGTTSHADQALATQRQLFTEDAVEKVSDRGVLPPLHSAEPSDHPTSKPNVVEKVSEPFMLCHAAASARPSLEQAKLSTIVIGGGTSGRDSTLHVTEPFMGAPLSSFSEPLPLPCSSASPVRPSTVQVLQSVGKEWQIRKVKFAEAASSSAAGSRWRPSTVGMDAISSAPTPSRNRDWNANSGGSIGAPVTPIKSSPCKRSPCKRSPAKSPRKAQEQQLTKLFRAWDANCDGVVTREDVQRLLRFVMETEKTDDIVANLMESADANKDGAIDFEEFRRWMFDQRNGMFSAHCEPSNIEARKSPSMCSALQQWFKLFDWNNSGFVDRAEFVEACLRMNPAADIEEARAYFRDMDHTGDGRITWQEFYEEHCRLFDAIPRPLEEKREIINSRAKKLSNTLTINLRHEWCFDKNVF